MSRKTKEENLQPYCASKKHIAMAPAKLVRSLALLLVIFIVLVQIGPWLESITLVKAETTIDRWGRVTGSNVNLRSKPEIKDNNVLATLALNSRVKVLTEVEGENTSYGKQWYKVEYTNPSNKVVTGYMVKALVELDPEITPDDEYQATLQALGFPQSYWPYLQAMHNKYPNWNFTPMFIDSKYTWDAILDAQSATGRSLIPTSWSNAYKSYASDAYDYLNDKWIMHDSNSWVMANRQTIGYYMDPRNWLYEETVFMFENLKYNADVHTKAGITSILKGTFMESGTFTYTEYDANNKAVGESKTGNHIDAFMAAATRTNVSPYHLASRARLEVVIGSGKSESVTGTYQDVYGTLDLTGLYNYYNIGSSQGTYPIRNGLEYAKYGPDRKPAQTETDNRYLIPWDSPWRSIVGGAVFIGSSYINRNQHTLYLQKFDLDDQYDGVFWHQYMGNIAAPAHEGKTTYDAYKNMDQLNNSFDFVIPVITGLPDKAVALPSNTSNRNPWLKNISVSGLSFDKGQKFDPAKTDYTITLDHSFKSVSITASTINKKAKTQGTGTYNLKTGTNIFTITGVAESGDKRSYTIKVIRKDKEGVVPPDVHVPQETIPALTFNQDLVRVEGNQISGLDINQGLNLTQNLRANLGVPAEFEVALLRADGTPLADDELVGTGSIVRVSYNQVFTQDYQVIIYGDINGDGRITSSDVNRAFNHVLKIEMLNDIYALAADTDHNDKVTSSDVNRMFNHVLKIEYLLQ